MPPAAEQSASDVTEVHIGRRLAYWRVRRNLSQQLFADRIGKSKSWVDKVERGVRRLDRFSLMQEIAVVLDIDVAQLVSSERRPTATPSHPVPAADRLERLRTALERYDWIAPAQVPPAASSTAEPAHLDAALRHGWLAYQRAHYADLTHRLLPEILSMACHRQEPSNQRCQAYQLCCATLTVVEATDLLHLVADRSLSEAHKLADPLVLGHAAVHSARALLGAGRIRAGIRVALTAARRLGGAQPFSVERIAAAGALFTVAMRGAAHLGDARSTQRFEAAAQRRAAMLATDNPLPWGSFGPASLRVDRINALVALNNGRGALTLAAQESEIRGGLTLAQQAHRFVVLARAYLLVGATAQAADAVLAADHIAPGEVHERPAVRRMVRDLVHERHGMVPVAFIALADRLATSPDNV